MNENPIASRPPDAQADGDAPPGTTVRIPGWLKLGFTFWVAAWMPFYASHYGLQNFLWFCDIGNFVLLAALWTGSRLLFSWQAVSLLGVQLVWTLDFAGSLVLGVHPFGGSEYMYDPAIPLHVRLLSLFHAATPPLLIWALVKFGYDRRAWALQAVTTWVVLPISFIAFGPDKNLNWVWGPFDKPQHVVHPLLYFALCMVAYPLVLYGISHAALCFIFRTSPRIAREARRT